jgi:hypothetical protein
LYFLFDELRVPLHKAFSAGWVPATRYKVLGPKGQPQGELSVALKFTPKVRSFEVVWLHSSAFQI